MPALVVGIHVLSSAHKDMDGRNKSGHDERVALSKLIWPDYSAALRKAASRVASR
jgi:hypothetical protein